MKALLVSKQRRLPRSHNLGVLLHLLEEDGEIIPDDVRRVARLADYAVEARYPGSAEPVTEQEYQDALAMASRCVQWVRSRIK